MIQRLWIIRNNLLNHFFIKKWKEIQLKKIKENFKEKKLLKEISVKRLFESKKIIYRKYLLSLFLK